MAQADLSESGESPMDGGVMDLVARRRAPSGAGSAEQTLRELADKEDIRELTAIYAQRVAHGLSNADLFTDDGAYIHRRSADEPAHAVRGRAALDAHYAPRADSVGVATPMIHNHVIEVTGDTARAICSIELRIGAGPEAIFATGNYQDRLRREGGAWKFVERYVTFFRWGPAAG